MSSAESTTGIARRPSADEKRRAVASRRLAGADVAWKPSEQPAWLTEQVYHERILPGLAHVSVPRLAAALGVSKPYAAGVRHGQQSPHPRHWKTLAELAGVLGDC